MKKRAKISREAKTWEWMHKTPSKTKRKKSTHINTRKKSTPISKKVLAIIFKVCPYVFKENENRGKQNDKM